MERGIGWGISRKEYLTASAEMSWVAHCLLLLACSIPVFSRLGGPVATDYLPAFDTGAADFLPLFVWSIPMAIVLLFLLVSYAQPVKGLPAQHIVLPGVLVICVLAAVLGHERWLLALVPIVLIALNYGKKWAISSAVSMYAIVVAISMYNSQGASFSAFLTAAMIVFSMAYLVGGITDINRELVNDLDRERLAFKNMVASLPLGICVIDNGQIVYRNSHVGDAVGKLCLSVVTSEDLVKQTPQNPVVINVELEDQTYRLLPTSYPNQSGGSVIVIVENLSQTRRLEEEIRRSSYLASIGEMAAGVAHEIWNPLTVIQGYVQLLLEGRHDRKLGEVKPYLETTLAEINRLGGIVYDFLNLASPQKLEKVLLNLNDVVDELRELLETESLRRDVQLDIELAPSLAQFNGDPASLKQVVLNLVTNAFQAVGTGGKVGVRTWQRDRYAILEVIDDGPGIPDELKEKVFMPFFSTKQSGTGIGLSICRRIALDHGGTLTCRSEPGNTRFSLEIPLDSTT